MVMYQLELLVIVHFFSITEIEPCNVFLLHNVASLYLSSGLCIEVEGKT